jgi:hypothetical protein
MLIVLLEMTFLMPFSKEIVRQVFGLNDPIFARERLLANQLVQHY